MGSLFLVNLAIKGIFVLVVAGLMVGALQRASAAVRHRIWAVAMVSLLAMPVLMLVVPTWQVSLLSYPPLPAFFVESEHLPDQPREDRAAIAVRSEVAGPVAEGASSFTTERQTISPAEHSPEAARSWLLIALLFWLGGALVLFSRLVFEIVQIWRATRLARPITEADWLQRSQHLAAQFLGSRRVRFVVSHRTAVPLTWGMRNPVILLPVAALAWSTAQQRAVLLHELAHIRRWDYPIHLLAQAGLTLHWFNPLAWFAARRMLIEREKACDDDVLAVGTEPTEYAHFLLEIAKAMLYRKTAYRGALSMARHSELESRVRSILDSDVRRSGVPRVSGMLFGVMVACTLPFLAAMQLWGSPAEVLEAGPVMEPVPETVGVPDTLGRSLDAEEASPATGRSRSPIAVRDTLPARVRLAMQALTAPKADDRAQAACDLGRWVIRPAIPFLIDQLQDDAPVAFVRCPYHETLGWNPANYVWKEPTPGEAAAVALAAIGGAAVEALVQALQHNDATVRLNAAWALGEVRLHENQERAVEALLVRLDDEDWWVRKTAAWALGEARSPVALGSLLVALNDSTWQVREQAAWALGELADPAAEAALTAALSDQQEPVQRMARWALNEMGSRGG